MKKSVPNSFKITVAVIALLSLLSPASLFAQNRGTIQGKVVTAKNEPADNVSIGLEGTSYGTTTKANGDYAFKAPAGSYKIIISYVGIERVEVPVTVTAGQTVTVPQITIRANLSQLTEVNVIANRANRFTRKLSADVAKIPLNNLENAQSYSVVTNELLKEQNVFNVEDALKNAPGIQKMWDATGRAGDGGGYFTLRGFVTQTRLRNGIAGLVTSGIDAVNIDKIEVIKGPSATLFGSTLTSFGGLVNRVTKKPYDSFGLEIGEAVGSYNLNRTTIDLNTPLGSNVSFRLNSAYNYEGSFQNYGQSRSFAVAPSLAIKANDKLSFLLESEVFVGRNSAKPFFFFYYDSPPKAMGVSHVSDLNINYKNAYVNDDIKSFSRSTNYFATVNYKFSDKLKSQTIFSSSNSYSNGASPYLYLLTDESAVAINNQLNPGTTLPNPPGNNNYVFRNDQSTYHSKLGAIEIQENINGDFNIGSTRHRFVVGLDFQRQNSHQIYFGNSYDFVPINDPNFNYGSLNKQAVDAKPFSPAAAFPYIYKTNTYSAYASDVVNITDRLIASVGLRVDRFENKGNYNLKDSLTAAPFSQTAFSPKFGLIYQPIKDALSLFANFQNGFQNLTPYLNASGQTVSPKIQNATQIEGGVKMALFNGKLNGTVSYYRINLTNVIRNLPGSGAQAIQVQDGTQLSKGFEAEIIANPIASVNIIAGFAYNNSKFTKSDANVQGLRPNTAGSPYLANFYASYRLTVTALKGLGIGFGGNYASSNKIINSVSEGSFELPSYIVLNSNLFYDKVKYRFGLSVNNLANKEYYTGYTTINPQRLRQFVLSASYKL